MVKRTGTADLPLHTGKAPRWLFERMVRLSAEILYVIAVEFGRREILRRLSDPFWFQAFGCLLGFDWHSSGLTTTVMGAVKEGLKRYPELGIFVAGGKGKASRKTVEEIDRICDQRSIEAGELFKRYSRLSAKVDNSALQDGFTLYHHCFVFTEDGDWAVVQQGMDPERGLARRYHWLGEMVENPVLEPHAAVCCDEKREVLNLVAKESACLQEKMVELVISEDPDKLCAEIELAKLSLPRRHHISLEDIDVKRLKKVILKAKEASLFGFDDLLLVRETGPKFLRALALTSELIYDLPASRRDPVRFSFAHGGKDGHPFPVNRVVYDHTIEFLRKIIEKTKLGELEKDKALRKLKELAG